MPDVQQKILNRNINTGNSQNTQGMGSFGYRMSGPVGSTNYMQNPMMSGAGMPGMAPKTPSGSPFKPLPMFSPKPLKGIR